MNSGVVVCEKIVKNIKHGKNIKMKKIENKNLQKEQE